MSEISINRILPYKLPLDRSYFYLVKEAKGLSLASIFKNNDFESLAIALKEYAKALAFFHQYFMDSSSVPETIDTNYILNFYRTILHGDAHWGNIFFHKESGTISFIDNETIVRTVERGETMAREMEKLLFYSSSNFGNCKASEFNADRCKVAIDAGIYFIKNYISNYPLEFQPNLKNYFLYFLPLINEHGNINQYVSPDAIKYWKQQIINLR